MTKKITTIIFDVDDTLYDVSTVSSLSSCVMTVDILILFDFCLIIEKR